MSYFYSRFRENNFITDAPCASTNAQIAITNPGGIRANINSGNITWGNLYTVQPFNNQLITMDLTGAQIRAALNQQWATSRMLQISGMKYTWDSTLGDDKVVSLTLAGGTLIDPDQTYSVTMNSFLASGGDGFTAFASGTNQVTGQVDLDALVDYVQQQTAPINVVAGDRIIKIK